MKVELRNTHEPHLFRCPGCLEDILYPRQRTGVGHPDPELNRLHPSALRRWDAGVVLHLRSRVEEMADTVFVLPR